VGFYSIVIEDMLNNIFNSLMYNKRIELHLVQNTFAT
jgi:hypothetical protein